MKINICRTVFVLIVFLLISCSEDTDKKSFKKFVSLASSKTGVDFTNIVKENEHNHHLVWESIYNGAGVGVGDVNNDGLIDIYFCGNMNEDKLFLNKGDFNFEDITSTSGISEESWSSGICMADVNNDGWLDIYVSKMSWNKDSEKEDLRANKLYINNGDLTFTESAEKYGVNDQGHTTQASFFDFNKDGFLDLYVMNAPSHRYDQKLEYINKNNIPYVFKDHLYLNKNGHFEDVTKETLGNYPHAFGLGLSTVDINQDGWTDIYVANDFEKPDLMLINQQGRSFKNMAFEKLKHMSYSSMGMDIADINNDTLYDIAVLDMRSQDHVRSKTNMPSMDIKQFWKNVANGNHFQYMSNILQLNNGKNLPYSEIGQLSGISSTDWSWSILLADIDNDGFKDALVTNGINRNIKNNDFNTKMKKMKNKAEVDLLQLAMETEVEKLPNFAFRNNGDLGFLDNSIEWGFDYSGFSFGASYADLDNDGDLDVIVSNTNDKAKIYQNNIASGHWVRFNITDGKMIDLNASVKIFYNGQMQVGELHNVRGYQSCSESMIHFGLANASKLDSLIIFFSNGKMLKEYDIGVDTLYKFDASQGKVNGRHSIHQINPLVKEITAEMGVDFRHQENAYNDFQSQILIPHMESRNGPFITSGDIDGDGTKDIFIGGAKKQAGQIYTFEGKNFLRSEKKEMEDMYEDMGSCLFDVDNDGDKDLYVVSGGGEHGLGHELNTDRLYINDGKGTFSKSTIDLPSSDGSIVIPFDLNKDGYLDLFVGGRMQGKRYPYPGTSYILINEKGKLSIDPNFKFENMGMVTSAATTDINQDGWEDLIVVGEWMHPTFLVNNQGILVDKSRQYIDKQLNGWWFEVKADDIDNDGMDEILLGNIGMNNKYRATEKKPLKVYGSDFNKDRSFDVVLAKNSKYGEVPIRGFECSSEQLPHLKRKFKTYEKFAHAEVSDILGEDIENALVLEANHFSSGILKKIGDKYEFTSFPNLAQISSVQGIETHDFNKDGLKDIILVGNLFDAEVETVRHDASVGLILLSHKDGSFTPVHPSRSGLNISTNCKDIEKLSEKGETYFIITSNNYDTKVYKTTD